ncbi:MAG TPA: zinc-ribbon domain-containing protein, partial [Myxococcales bacterium]|nr:zinc-ribbon domain-containing protein [Myxococcales bacterium]
MKVSCPSCGTNYNIDDKRIPPGGAKLKCAKCQSTFPIKRDGAVPAAGASARPGTSAPRSSAAIPLPGVGSVRTSPAVQASRGSALGADMNVATNPAIPLPGGSSGPRPSISAAVPLPGGAAANLFDDEATHAVPLPGGDGPEPSSPSPWDGESTRVASIPVPAAAVRPTARQAAAIPLPRAGAAPTSPGKPLGTVPLPGSSSGLTTSPGMPFARSSSPISSPAIPLPGSRPSSIPLPVAAPRAPEPDAGDGLDFADADLIDGPAVPLPSPPSISAMVPQPAGQDSNESTQMVSSADSGAFDFGDIPPPPEPPPPSASEDGGLDFGADFGDPAPPAAPEADVALPAP